MVSKEKFKKIKITLLFFISFFSMLFLNIKFIYFAPLIVYLFYRFSLISILWISILIGLLQDLFSATYFSINALSYLFTTLFLYKQKRFFTDGGINLSILATIYSFLFSIINISIYFIFDKNLIITLKWAFSDLIVFPILDGIYTFIFFAIPIIIFEKITKLGFKNLWMRAKLIFQK